MGLAVWLDVMSGARAVCNTLLRCIFMCALVLVFKQCQFQEVFIVFISQAQIQT